MSYTLSSPAHGTSRYVRYEMTDRPVLVCFLMTFIGFGLMFLGGYKLVHQQVLLHTAKRTTGMVMTFQQSSRRTKNHISHTSYYPVFEFTPAGQTGKIRVTSEEDNNSQRYGVGDRVSVLYNPRNPKDAEIESGARAFLWHFYLLVGIGLFFVWASIASIIKMVNGYETEY